MNALRRPWLLYALFLALGLGAMGWITRQALRTEQAEIQAQGRALLEEKIRLGLWRMDSTLALFLSPETARPWHHFETFHQEGGRAVPSPMLVMDDPMVLLRFQVDAKGRFTSPLVPRASEAALARRAVSDPPRLEAAALRLGEVQKILTLNRLREAMVRQGAVLLTHDQMEELRARSRKASPSLGSPYDVNQGVWTPFWVGRDLFLARQVWVGDQELFQGTWLEWGAVKEVLMSAVMALVPGAELEPAPEATSGDRDRRMGALPVRLQSGRQTLTLPGRRPPSHALLILGWATMLLGALAGGLVLRHALELSERRGAFASAVTHELRTPLTTFRLYTELLAKGMVPDPEEQRALLGSLLDESDRLDHLVKNVLAFARLESRRESAMEMTTVEAVVRRPWTRLAARAGQGGLDLELNLPESLQGIDLLTDPLLVEQILYNLVDNAAKYAAGARDSRLHVEVLEHRGGIAFRVKDHGPGIDPADRRHLFRPFHKSAQKAARTAPGVGLGLALCRRLARSLGGDLEWEGPQPEGASFLFSLPRS